MIRFPRARFPLPPSVGLVLFPMVLLAPPAGADVTATGGEEPVPPAVIQDAWQRTWNTVEVSVRSDAPHWTLRSCPTAQDPEGSTIHAQGTGPRNVRVVVVEEFSWELVDRVEPLTFCAQVVSDDGAGHVSLPVRTSVSLPIDPRIALSGRDPSSPYHSTDAPAGRWNRSWYQFGWKAPYGRQYVYGGTVPGVPVEVRRRSSLSGPWTWMGRFTSDGRGAFTVGYLHEGDTEIQVCRPGTWCRTVLDHRIHGTTATVLASAPATARRNTTFPVYATVLPRYAGRPVYLCENHGPGDCWQRSVKRTDARGRVVFSVHSGSKRTSRSWRVWSPTHYRFYGDGWDVARPHNVRIR